MRQSLGVERKKRAVGSVVDGSTVANWNPGLRAEGLSMVLSTHGPDSSLSTSPRYVP